MNDNQKIIPIFKDKEHYVCYLLRKGKMFGLSRRYTPDTLPSFLIRKITNTQVTETSHPLPFSNLSELAELLNVISTAIPLPFNHYSFNSIPDTDLLSIRTQMLDNIELGFQIKPNCYIVSLSQEEYNNLVGKTIDTREKSKDKSKESIR